MLAQLLVVVACMAFTLCQYPEDPQKKAIQLKNSQAALNEFTDTWTELPPATQPNPDIVNEITGGGSFGESLNPFFMSGYNQVQMNSVLKLWPLSAHLSTEISRGFEHCGFLAGEEVHFEDAGNTATYIRVVYIKEGAESTKYVALKTNYIINFDTVKDEKALDRFKCYMRDTCKAVDHLEKAAVIGWMKNKAIQSFVGTQSPTKVSIDKNLEYYKSYLPADYQVPLVCKMNQIDTDGPTACNHQDPLLNQAAGVMQTFRAAQVQQAGGQDVGSLNMVPGSSCYMSEQALEQQLNKQQAQGHINAPLRQAVMEAVQARLTKRKPKGQLKYAVREAFFLPQGQTPDHALQLKYARVAVLVHTNETISALYIGAKAELNSELQLVAPHQQSGSTCQADFAVCNHSMLVDALQPSEQSQPTFDFVLKNAIDQFTRYWQQVSGNE